MRKKKLITFFVLLSVTLILQLLPDVNQFNFLIKNLAIFSFITYLIVISLIYIFNRYVRKHQDTIKGKRLVYLRSYTIFIFVILLSAVSFLQVKYIQLFETPALHTITYYDKYGNLLCDNTYQYEVPEVEIIENTQSKLQIRFKNRFVDYKTMLDLRYKDHYMYKSTEGYSVIDISINYDQNNKIVYFEKQHAIVTNLRVYQMLDEDSVEIDENSGYYDIDLYHEYEDRYLRDEQYYADTKEITIYEYLDDSLTKVKTIYYMNEMSNFDDLEKIEHYNFTNITPQKHTETIISFDNNSFDVYVNGGISIEGKKGFDSEGNRVISMTDSQYNESELSIIDNRLVYRKSLIEYYEYKKFKDSPFYYKSDGFLFYFDREDFSINRLNTSYKYNALESKISIKEFNMNYTYIIQENDFGYQIENYGFEDFLIDERGSASTIESLVHYELFYGQSNKSDSSIIYDEDPVLLFDQTFLEYITNN